MKLHPLRMFCCIVGALTGFQPPLVMAQDPGAPGTLQPAPKLKIAVVTGGNSANLVKEMAAAQLTVEVRDAENRPVPAAVVNFQSPEVGPSVRFPNGARSFSAVTETNGRTSVQEMDPLGIGSFPVKITAESEGRSASIQITQTNYLSRADAMKAHAEMANLIVPEPAERRGLSRRAVAAIIIGVAAAAAAGAVVATRGSGSSSQAGGIGAGPPTVGAPH